LSEQTIALFTRGSLQLQASPPLALYIHLPWCIRKCPYCDFNSHEGPRGGAQPPFALYVDALIADLDAQLPKVWGRKLWSIFIGGGTPSLFPPDQIDRLLSAVFARLGPPTTSEVTLEANPGTFETGRFRDFRQAGVTRLSIGIQTFNDRLLKALGRVHDSAQAVAAAHCAATVFDTFNLDLMYGLPGQSLEDAQADIDQALAFSPPHLSLYQLTIEPDTAFAQRPPVLPDDDAQADIEEAVRASAADAGLVRYEISAFAKPGHMSRHNLNYWQFGDYLGIGAGAHAKLSFPSQILRELRVRQPQTYMEKALGGDAILQSKPIAAADLPFEFALNALRLTAGVPLAWYAERCGRPLQDLTTVMARARGQGLLEDDTEHLRATPTGLRFLNDLQQMFLSG
jgi:oxygen-independent coproporphyrinogen-3 oxidase